MGNISILDCTLRDGGYVNDFCFGEHAIKEIINKLSKASIDIIECGFMKSKAFNPQYSLFGSVEAVKNVIGKKNTNILYVGMIQYGEISNEEIGFCEKDSIDGIRLTFHEHEIEPAFILGKQLIEKGYKVFMQPVGTVTYTDEALLHLVQKINELKPFAFYIVDTLGTMYKKDLLRMFYLVDNNLHKSISLGFHSHNNLQLSFANAQELIELNTTRNIIIDSSVFGMGRGAGNLNTELLTQYINKNVELHYDNLEIIEIIDKYIRPLSIKYKWGYDSAYYIASITGCHPNYATFLLNKQTLYVKDIYAMLNNLDNDKRALFNKQYIGEEYVKYMNHHINDEASLKQISEKIKGREVLLLAPGKSIKANKRIIKEIVNSKQYFVISINFIPNDFDVDIAFISNIKRFGDVQQLLNNKVNNVNIVITSNIEMNLCDDVWIVDYASYINEELIIVDNAGLMCLNLLKKIGIEKIKLAGFDGYSSKSDDNFCESKLCIDIEDERLRDMNTMISKKLNQLSRQMQLDFLTNSIYQETK